MEHLSRGAVHPGCTSSEVQSGSSPITALEDLPPIKVKETSAAVDVTRRLRGPMFSTLLIS